MRLLSMVMLVAACGGGAPRGPTTPAETAPALLPVVAEQRWYRTTTTCGQGPFELEVPTATERWDQDIELRLSTPHRVALHAVMLVDGAEVAKTSGVFDGAGTASGGADNSKCVADARERLALRTGGGTPGAPGTPGTPGTRVTVTPPPAGEAPRLEIDEQLDGFTEGTTVVRFHVREHPIPPGARVRIRFWSIEPNLLAGVRFGAIRVAWRPNVGEAAWDAFLARRERERIAMEQRYLEEERRRVVVQTTVVVEDPRAAAERERRAELEARRRAEEAERARLRAEEDRRRRELDAALAADRARRRAAWCAAHPESRDCWGAGGLRVHLELEQRARERDAYCTANPEDARCWSDGERARRVAIWNARVTQATAPPPPPDGPPPAPLADPRSPKPSENAEWRDGYWLWIDAHWVWLAGQWRVPDSDIEQEKTVQAPAAPPPPQVETVAVAPARTAIWVAGYWMWNGTSWVWIPGSWQVRPTGSVRWRAPEWRARGSVHILIPGGWIR